MSVRSLSRLALILGGALLALSFFLPLVPFTGRGSWPRWIRDLC